MIPRRKLKPRKPRPVNEGGRARKGLKKVGMRTYQVEGPAGSFQIERDGRSRFLLRAPHTIPPFHNGEYRRLIDARRDAESWAGL